MSRFHAVAIGSLLLGIVLAAAGCRSAETQRHPADAIIQKETDPEARRELEAVKDATDEEMRERVAELDAEIERLRKENEELRRKIER